MMLLLRSTADDLCSDNWLIMFKILKLNMLTIILYLNRFRLDFGLCSFWNTGAEPLTFA